MSIDILGLHHVTAVAGEPRRNSRFWTETLGMRRVKITVNFDDPGTYHLYFGDRLGRPGSIWTTFPHPQARPGEAGVGEVAETALAVPPGSLDFWKDRLGGAGAAPQADDRGLTFTDPDGTRLRLEPSDALDGFESPADSPVPEAAPRRIAGVTLCVERPDDTAAFLQRGFGFVAASGEADRFTHPDHPDAGYVRLVPPPPDLRRPPRLGAGSVHHVAFRVPDDDAQAAAAAHLRALGLQPTPVQDRDYFRSIYFRIPGGVLFEIATDTPGFATDEPAEHLGETLQLPARYAHLRQQIATRLTPLENDDAD